MELEYILQSINVCSVPADKNSHVPVSLSCRYRCLEVITTPVPHPSDNIKTWLADETHHEVVSLSFFSHYIDMHGITCNQNGTTLHLEQQVIKKKKVGGGGRYV